MSFGAWHQGFFSHEATKALVWLIRPGSQSVLHASPVLLDRIKVRALSWASQLSSSARTLDLQGPVCLDMHSNRKDPTTEQDAAKCAG